MEKIDVTVIGAGAIGLAVSHALSGRGKEITVIERNASFGQETSSRNSEVIHAGLYYPLESLKARTCIRGKELLYRFCESHRIGHRKTGKLVVATEKSGTKKIKSIYENAISCGVNNLEFLGKEDIKKMEKNILAESAIFSPETGILDSHAFMKALFRSARQSGVDFAFSVEVTDIKKEGPYYKITVREPKGDTFCFHSNFIINCAGLWSDKVAALSGMDIEKYSYRIHYCKGQYFRIEHPEKFAISHLVYPPPTETDLGIHLTPDLAGGLRLGPDATYVSHIDYCINEKDKQKFLDSAIKFLPDLTADDLAPDTAGVRPKLQKEGEPFRDFVISEESEKGFPNFINLIGIESPGLTGCLAISEMVKKMVRGN